MLAQAKAEFGNTLSGKLGVVSVEGKDDRLTLHGEVMAPLPLGRGTPELSPVRKLADPLRNCILTPALL